MRCRLYSGSSAGLMSGNCMLGIRQLVQMPSHRNFFVSNHAMFFEFVPSLSLGGLSSCRVRAPICAGYTGLRCSFPRYRDVNNAQGFWTAGTNATSMTDTACCSRYRAVEENCSQDHACIPYSYWKYGN